MSTKTTIKRIALVAVSALGLGVVTAVAPASAANGSFGTKTTEYINAISLSTNNAPVAGANGTAVEHTVTFKSSTTAAVSTAVNPYVILATKPATSELAEDSSYDTSAPALKEWRWVHAAVNAGTYSSTKVNAASRDLTAGTSDTTGAGGYSFYKGYLSARYDVAGTYSWVFWDDLNADGIVNGIEFAQTINVVVSSATTAASLAATVAPYNSTSSVKGTVYGSLVKITLKDTAGNAANVDSAGGIKVTVSNSAKISGVNADMTVTDAASYTLGRNDFDGDGNAWVNVVDATAETVTLTLAGSGSAASSFTAPAATYLTFSTTCTASCGTTLSVVSTATSNTTSTVRYATSGASVASSFYTGNASDTVPTTVQLVDTNGKVTGLATAGADLVVAGSSTATYAGSFSVTSKFTATSQAYSLTPSGATGTAAGGTAYTLTSTAATNGAITLTQAVIKAAVGAAVTIKGNIVDSFGAGAANVTITPTISGRNSTLVLSTLVSDSAGDFSFTYTDASTSTTALTDTITFTPSSGTAASASVTRTSATNLGVTKIILDTPSTNAYDATTPLVAGDAKSVKTYSTINAAKGGATGGKVSVNAYVTDVSGNAIEGVPVTFSVAGTGAAITSTTATVYTNNSGVATAKLYAWVSGDYTVTAKYGTVSDTAVSSWRQDAASGAYARTISAVANGQTVTATVKDRYGNPVVGASVSASRTGSGYFAGGTSSVNGATTGADGTVDFIFVGSGNVTVNLGATTSTTSYGDSAALEGYVGTSKVTASAAGDSTTDETGVGAAYAPAGIHSATVDVSGTSTSDAIDAANEATDAANAATDAANAAAEAADAATAAAQDAQAAVAELATKVASLIAGIKAQITTLTNLVIKIQKKVRA